MAEPPTRNWSQRLHGTDEFRQTWVLESDAEARLAEAERQRDAWMVAASAQGDETARFREALERREEQLRDLAAAYREAVGVDVPKGPEVHNVEQSGVPVGSGDTPKEKVTHGRHCTCSACARFDWSEPHLAPCGMHGSSCPPVYAPLGAPGSWVAVGSGDTPE